MQLNAKVLMTGAHRRSGRWCIVRYTRAFTIEGGGINKRR